MQTSTSSIRLMSGPTLLFVVLTVFFIPTQLNASSTVNVDVGPGGQTKFTDQTSGTSTTTITAGDTVIWTWQSTHHTVTSRLPTSDPQFFGSPLQDSGIFQHTFNVAGTYVYDCTPHRSSGMTGTVIVQAASQGTFSTITFDLGGTVLGLKSPGKILQFTNTSNASLDVSGLAITGDFTQTNDCPAPLPTQQSCNITIFFTPTAAGTRTGTLSLTIANATPVQLTGVGVNINISPTRITRPPVKVGINFSPHFDSDIARREKLLIIVTA